jgi:hypothetical protein
MSMGVYIKGMEMPTSCYKCPLRRRDGMDIVCPVAHERFSVADVNIFDYRLDNCLLVPVPPHGELCDKTALVKKIGENIDKAKDRSYDWWYACTVAYDFALAAPTIIPAEEGET